MQIQFIQHLGIYMRIRVSEAAPLQLDWLVAKCEGGCDPEYFNGVVWITTGSFFARVRRIEYTPSTNWSQGGHVIEREKLAIMHHDSGDVSAIVFRKQIHAKQGHTPLIAAMRCYVASKLGDEVDIPEELK